LIARPEESMTSRLMIQESNASLIQSRSFGKQGDENDAMKVLSYFFEEEAQNMIDICVSGPREDENWERMFSILNNYRSREGHCNLSSAYMEDGVEIGKWLYYQKEKRKGGKLKAEQERKLKEIGVSLSLDSSDRQMHSYGRVPNNDRWEMIFSHMLRFVQQEGHSEVPRSYKTEDGINLGIWLNNQKNLQRKDKLYPERERKLKEIGISFSLDSSDRQMYCYGRVPNNDKWEMNFAHMLRFVQQEGHSEVPRRYKTKDGINLGIWLNNQKNLQRKGELNHKRERKLEEVGVVFYFELSSDLWESNYACLLQFVQQQGHPKVPYRYKTEYGINLGLWLHHQKSLYKERKLKPELERKLKIIGVVFPRYRSVISWERNYALLLKFVQQEGHSKVPHRYKTKNGISLGMWLSKQKSIQRKEGLPPERERKFREIETIFSSNVNNRYYD